MRPVDPKFIISQHFASMATEGVAANADPASGVGYYVYLYGNYQPMGHAGLDVATPVGTPVYAMKAGTVVYCDWDVNLPGGPNDWSARWFFYQSFGGRILLVKVGPQEYHAYCHLSAFKVKQGDVVKEGQLIALTGSSSGGVDGGVAPHLHVERLVDPVSYYSGGGLIYGRSDPIVLFSTFKPISTTTPTGLFVTLKPAEEALVLDRNKKYLDSPVSQVDEKVWATAIKRGGKEISALQELADCKTLLLTQQATLAGLLKAIEQLSKAQGTPVDLAAVTAAAEAGAERALADLNATVTFKQGVAQ